MSATKEKLHDIIEQGMRKLQVVNFIDKTFNEIPTQDNPAFMNKKEWDNLGEDGCILITKQNEDKSPYKNRGKYCVLRITPVEDNEEEDSVTYLGLFWESHLAILFAEMASELTRNLLPDEINSKEEHEQYLKDINFPTNNIINQWLDKNGNPEIDKQVEQEDKELCKQESLEELKKWKEEALIAHEINQKVIEKLMAEKKLMYSDKEVENIIHELMHDVHCGDLCYGEYVIDFKLSARQWFEHFKNK